MRLSANFCNIAISNAESLAALLPAALKYPAACAGGHLAAEPVPAFPDDVCGCLEIFLHKSLHYNIRKRQVNSSYAAFAL